MGAATPHLSAYLAKLPDGLDSYPEAKTKASLHRGLIEQRPIADGAGLPTRLQDMLANPIPVSSWIPSVHHHAMVLASRDLSCEDDEDFREFCRMRQRVLFGGRLYRVMLAITSPSTLLRTASLRWTSFHRGSSFELEELTKTGARISIQHPPMLLDGLLADALVEGLSAILVLSGAVGVNLRASERAPARLCIEGTWSL